MKMTFIAFLIATAEISVAQDTSAIQKLQHQFRQAYYDHNEPGANFFNRLHQASVSVFRIENDAFFEELTARKKKNKNIPNDSLAGEIFDIVVSWFTQNHLWDNNPDAPSRYKSIFNLYKEKMCPCATAKILSKDYRIEGSDLAGCAALLATDTSYISTLQRDAGTSTLNELIDIAQLAGVYMFEKCPVVYKFFVMIPRDEVISSASVRTRWFFHDAEKKVVDLYNARSFARLASFFPTYKSYSHEISQV